VRSLSRAAIIAVGSELLTPSRVDTNSLWVTEQLNGLGIQVVFKVTVGDDRDELAHAFRDAMGRVDLVVCTGGLGPTDDDVTREVVSAVLRRPLAEDAGIVDRIQSRFTRRGARMPEINRRQALVPAGATVLVNVKGTAPGLWLDVEDRVALLLPGPPRELKPMVAALVDGELGGRASGMSLQRRAVRIVGRTESHAEEVLRPLYARWANLAPPVWATILGSPGHLELQLTTQASEPLGATRVLDTAVSQVEASLGQDVYSTDGRSLEDVVGDLLARQAWRIAIGESCTGGLLTSRLTDVPGSSRYVDQAVVAYANAAKVSLLGVPAALIDEQGAVSEQVAEAMARGVQHRAASDVGVGVTGIAGPGGGSPEKPVGTVAIAVVTAVARRVRLFRFLGERELVKFQASQAALDMVRRLLLEQ